MMLHFAGNSRRQRACDWSHRPPIDIEMKKQLSEKNLRAYSAREKTQEAEEIEKLEKLEKFDQEWSEGDRREKRVGSWRDFQHDPEAKRAKAANFKEESREDHGEKQKFGVVQLEEWKKKWR